jgi:ketosteroid isomerase-like protein
MRKLSLATTLVAVVSLFAFIQIACQPAADTNRSDAVTAPTNANRETVDAAAIEAELLRIERDWPRVVKERDVAAVGRVEADDAIFVYADGSLGNKQRDLADISSGAMTADDIEMSDLKVKVLDNDAAIVTGQTEIKNGRYKMPDGKTADISGKYRFIDTFARQGGDWKLVAGMSTKITAPAASASPAAAAPAVSPAMTPSPVATAPRKVPPPSPPASPMPKATP